MRALNIDFDLYTEGDHAFKKELGLAILKNLAELGQALDSSLEHSDPKQFLDGCHKAKVTLSMIADKEFDEIIQDLRECMLAQHSTRLATLSASFHSVSGLIMASLGKEIDSTIE